MRTDKKEKEGVSKRLGVRFAQKSAIKSNEQKGACSHFAMAEQIIEENLTNLFKSYEILWLVYQ